MLRFISVLYTCKCKLFPVRVIMITYVWAALQSILKSSLTIPFYIILCAVIEQLPFTLHAERALPRH